MRKGIYSKGHVVVFWLYDRVVALKSLPKNVTLICVKFDKTL